MEKCVAFESYGHLCMCKRMPDLGRIVVCYPLFKDGTPDWKTEVIPEPERIPRRQADELRRIGQKLGCKVY